MALYVVCAFPIASLSVRILAFRPATPTRKYHLLAPKFRPFSLVFFSQEMHEL